MAHTKYKDLWQGLQALAYTTKEGSNEMTYRQYKEAVRKEVAELLKAQADLSLTKEARQEAHSKLTGLFNGSAEKAWEIFDLR